MGKVKFNINKKITLRDRKHLKIFIDQLFATEGKKLDQLTVVGLNDDELLHMNNSFLNHDYYTDILTFDMSDNDASVIGELYISTDRVLENAMLLQNRPDSELLRVIFHGCLHLCGYNDKSGKQKILMTNKEDYYLSMFQISVPRGTQKP